MTDQYNDMGEVECPVCDGTGVVCENHRDRPWDGMSDHAEACGCGAGAPCIRCSPDPTRQMGTGKIPTPQPNVDEGDGK